MIVSANLTYLASINGKSEDGHKWQVVDLLPEGDRPISISADSDLDFSTVDQGDELTCFIELRNSARNNGFYARLKKFSVKGG